MRQKTTFGHKRKSGKSWISVNSWRKVEDRRENKKRKVNGGKSSKQRPQKKAEYQRIEKGVNSSFRNDKREWANNIAQKAEDAVRQGKIKGAYKATRKWCNAQAKTS